MSVKSVVYGQEDEAEKDKGQVEVAVSGSSARNDGTRYGHYHYSK